MMIESIYFPRSTCRVSAWQTATMLPISSKSVQPVPAWVEEPASMVRQSSSGGATNNPPFRNMPYEVGCQNWQTTASFYYVASGENIQHTCAHNMYKKQQ